ncbi:unnamed protein product [Caenorhabditis angaria]|uniref:2-oxoglutarate dehydrogenase E1 component/KDG C-terminal domain-containing protein n=1 Tax=Caenorhabditis angaria TaxID=860376 RepID=A0A9P1IYN5_9PELO|nr:unnamed protein product [Caenorhabditis angaria]
MLFHLDDAPLINGFSSVNRSQFVWSQEEPRNAGAWTFVNPRFENALGVKLKFAGRRELAWTATAVGEHHTKEAEQVINQTFA